jgi:hypothetical protein
MLLKRGLAEDRLDNGDRLLGRVRAGGEERVVTCAHGASGVLLARVLSLDFFERT